jgi:hypothetical protein
VNIFPVAKSTSPFMIGSGPSMIDNNAIDAQRLFELEEIDRPI